MLNLQRKFDIRVVSNWLLVVDTINAKAQNTQVTIFVSAGPRIQKGDSTASLVTRLVFFAAALAPEWSTRCAMQQSVTNQHKRNLYPREGRSVSADITLQFSRICSMWLYIELMSMWTSLYHVMLISTISSIHPTWSVLKGLFFSRTV